MSIDINNYYETAVWAIGEQVDAIHKQMLKVSEAYHLPGNPIGFSEAMDKLEQMLRTASDSVEVLQNYNGQYDRIARWCWGDRPGCYEVQCRLCKVQALCAEETERRHRDTAERPDCYGRNPLAKHTRCWDCSLFRLCLREQEEYRPSGKSDECSTGAGKETTGDQIGDNGRVGK